MTIPPCISAILLAWVVVVDFQILRLGAAPSAPDGASPSWDLVIKPSFPSGVALVNETGHYQITARNKPGTTGAVTLRLTAQIPGKPVSGNTVQKEWPVSIGPDATARFTWNAPTEKTGYWALSATVLQAEQVLGQTTSALLVTDPPSENRLPAAQSFFGTMFIRDAKAAARIGVRVERRQAVWEWLQRQGPEAWDWTGIDKGISDRAEQGIGTILTIRPEIRPKWAKWKSVEELASPDHLPDFTAFVRTVVSRYKDRILAVEIMNEPDLEVSRNATGSLPPTEVYARILKAGYEASKNVAPGLPVIGLDVSGVDFPRLSFSKDVLSRTNGYMDIFGGHPYNHSRYVGGDALPESPRKMDAAGRMRSMAALMQAHGLPPRIWSTEFGWALHLDEPLSSPSARLFAAFTAQAIALSKSVPEVEKLFWFAATFPGKERSSSYGLFRKADERANYIRPDGNWFPSPSAAAYATCARLLERATFVHRFTIGPLGHGIHFSDTKDGRSIVILWMENAATAGGSARLRLPAKTPLPQGGKIFDALGGEIPFSHTFDLEPLPLFAVVSAADADRFEQNLRSAIVEALEPIVIQDAHISGQNQISLEITNTDLRAIPVKIFQAGQMQSARSRLLESGVNTLTIPAADLVLGEPGITSVTLLNERTSATVTAEIRHYLQSLPQIDSRPDSFAQMLRQTATPLVLDRRDQVLPADPGVDWRGPDDLSLAAWAGWNPDGIALVVDVKDDIHAGPPLGVLNLWSFDSLQVAFDLGNRAQRGYDNHCHEFSFALDSSGNPAVVDGSGARPVFPSDAIRIQRHDTRTRYEIFFPWSALGGQPIAAGGVFRMNFIANDRDGATRKCWIGPAPGIGEAKQPAAFRQWILR